MKLRPAIDLLDGQVVTLVQGVPGTQTTERPDAATVMNDWTRQGAEDLHVVDLNAALGRGDQTLLVRDLVESRAARIQVGGGIRTTEQARRLLQWGAERIVVGTRAIEDPAWLADLTHSFPQQVVLAIDARRGAVATHGWTKTTQLDATDLARRVAPLPLAAILYTSIDVEGRLSGVDRAGLRAMRAATRLPLIASGGIASYDDLRFLKALPAEEAILGAALYQDRIQLPVAQNLVAEV